MALDRCIALSLPYTYHSLITPMKTRISLLVAILTAAIITLLPVFGFGSYMFNMRGRVMCKSISSFINPYDEAYFIFYTSSAVMLLLSVIFCNVVMVRQVLKLQKVVEPASQTLPTTGERRMVPKLTNEFRLAMTILMLSAVFLLCWGTIMVYEMWEAATGGFSLKFLQASILLVMINHTIDPLVYVITRKQFRRGVVELFSCFCRRFGQII
ncbi:cannabinoid receptor 1-like [Saccoglossus kowalevskii]|uniref:Cannabinoid receptor 1-like n=1 Tax=Saccoglossus kowalevskii TaxID=10224 RepID=A0ABM0MV66_SACKO|nr:PREDICTED: cannabinoid receptor 1-like [Saccoglossus kowalevskii]